MSVLRVPNHHHHHHHPTIHTGFRRLFLHFLRHTKFRFKFPSAVGCSSVQVSLSRSRSLVGSLQLCRVYLVFVASPRPSRCPAAPQGHSTHRPRFSGHQDEFNPQASSHLGTTLPHHHRPVPLQDLQCCSSHISGFSMYLLRVWTGQWHLLAVSSHPPRLSSHVCSCTPCVHLPMCSQAFPLSRIYDVSAGWMDHCVFSRYSASALLLSFVRTTTPPSGSPLPLGCCCFRRSQTASAHLLTPPRSTLGTSPQHSLPISHP